MKKTSLTAVILELVLFLAHTMKQDEARAASKGPVVMGDCFAQGAGPEEPVMCT
jgi:hypothetical protein